MLLDTRGELHRLDRPGRRRAALQEQTASPPRSALDVTPTRTEHGPRRGAAPRQRGRPHDRARARPGAAARRGAAPRARRRGGGCSARRRRRVRSGSGSPRTSSRRTARSCWPATPTRGPTRAGAARGARGRRARTCRSPPFTLERLATESAPVPDPWPPSGPGRLRRAARHRRSRRPGAGVARPGRAAGAARSRSGTRCAAGRSTTRCTGSPSTGTCSRPPRGRREHDRRGVDRPRPAARRRAAARHRQGLSRATTPSSGPSTPREIARRMGFDRRATSAMIVGAGPPPPAAARHGDPARPRRPA